MLGERLAHYQVLEKLGEGGMGIVYKAWDTHLDRFVALKVLPPQKMADPERKRRFVREAKAASALNHPNIITIHDIETADAADFIVMEFVEGRSLDLLIAGGPLGADEALGYAVQVAAALAAAHAAGIVHRDIKPANVMVTAAGQVKVLDFGLAKLSEPVAADPSASTRTASLPTEEGVILGTVAYMSPEQAQGKPVDVRTDVFSCGIVLYEMLAGKRPFQGDSRLSVLSAILSESPAPRVKKLRPDAPSDVEKVVARSLEKDRERRYASASELHTDLLACHKRLASPGLGVLLRKPKVAVLVVMLVVALIASATWFVIQSRRQNWARNVALPEIARLLEEENFDAAFRLGRQAERYIPGDRQLLELQRYYATRASIRSTPPGADVYVKGYLNVDADWLHVGKTPIDGTPIPPDYLRWKVTKEGFAPAEGAAYSIVPVQFTLHPTGDTPSGMVPVPGGAYRFRNFPPVKLEDYWLDKYEVTNEQFKQFVDQGGYEKREYWKHRFVKGGKVVSWEEAIAEFRDATGRPGPSTWQLGTYGEGRSQFPVNGVSWYEAAAYAEFAGKSLPTVYHWLRAHATPQASQILRLSNFSGEGPAQVGRYAGLSPHGSYDMAGNVREWCWNALANVEGAQRYILGASWSEAPYRFPGPGASHPWDRSPTNGFRCAKYGTSPPAALTAPIERKARDLTTAEPVSDEVFQVYRSFYSYERTDLEPAVEEVDDSALHWRREKVTFNAAYGGERVIAYLFLPRNAEPPYQTIIYFASGLARRARSSDEMNSDLRFVDFLPRIGRAVLFLVYKGTYERHLDHPVTVPFWTQDLIISWSRDFSRSIDYLETRPDIDHGNLGYFSFSNPIVPILSAIDGRIKAGAHIGAGLAGRNLPPEYNPIHFAPRAKEPTLLIGGRYDFLGPVDTSQKPLLRLLGAPEKDKRLALFDTGHVVYPGAEMIKEVLDWFDRYLGPVKTK